MLTLNTLCEPLCEPPMGPSGLLEKVSSEVGFLMYRRGKAILRCRVPTAIRQLSKVKALVETGVGRLQLMEQLGISKASYYRCFVGCVG